MKQKWKVIAGVIALFAFIGICSFAYQSLSKSYKAENKIDFTEKKGELDQKQTQESVGEQPESGETSPEEEEKIEAPDITILNAKGEEVKLSDFKGKPVVLNFWASWCSPCKEEMPEFDKVWEEIGEDVHFLMVNMTDGMRETQKKAKKFIEDKGFNFPVYYDTEQDAAYTYQVTSLPTTIFIDAEGYMITGAMGMIDEEILRKGIGIIQPETTSEEAGQVVKD